MIRVLAVEPTKNEGNLVWLQRLLCGHTSWVRQIEKPTEKHVRCPFGCSVEKGQVRS